MHIKHEHKHTCTSNTNAGVGLHKARTRATNTHRHDTLLGKHTDNNKKRTTRYKTHLKTVVERCGGGVEVQVTKGTNLGSLPATLLRPVNLKHVVTEHGAKQEAVELCV